MNQKLKKLNHNITTSATISEMCASPIKIMHSLHLHLQVHVGIPKYLEYL